MGTAVQISRRTRIVSSLASFLLPFFVFFFVTACADKVPGKSAEPARPAQTGQTQDHEKKAAEEARSAELEARITSSPMLITSDYFRESGGEGKPLKLFGDSKREKELEERLAHLEQRLMGLPQRAKDAHGAPVLRRKVVFLSLLGDVGLDALALLPAAMRRTDGLVPMDASQLGKLLEDRGMSVEDLAVAASRREIAALAGVHAYILVYFPQNQIPLMGTVPNLRLDVIHALESTLIGSYLTTVDDFDVTARKISDDVIRGTEWSCRVVKVEDGKIYLNAGRLTGLQPGDRLKVNGRGRELVDPLTKRSLGFAPGGLKGEIVIEDLFGTDASVATSASGEVFDEGDVVSMAGLA